MTANPELSDSSPASPKDLVRIVSEWTPSSGIHQCAIDGLDLIRSNAPHSCTFTVYEPALGFVIQGHKAVRLGDRHIRYGPLNYGVSAVHLPVQGWVLDATPEHPYLAVKFPLDPQEITELVLELGDRLPRAEHASTCSEGTCGLRTAPMDEPMQQALGRLLALLRTPEDIPVLAPLVRREILYRALMGEIGPYLRKFAAADSQMHRISRVISILRNHFAEPLRIREVAEEVNMSESSLFHMFKQVTRMSPLQFQKKLRLHEARRLMLAEGLEAATASYRVGYESPSQFSREYSRLFGAPPRADVSRLRGEPMATPA